jgi:hypothetical protein
LREDAPEDKPIFDAADDILVAADIMTNFDTAATPVEPQTSPTIQARYHENEKRAKEHKSKLD